ncbi:MAG TPA: YbjN domain-containing protein [Alphaproteobacteria bacterium]|nr:YbjN domain-containing protein [Alphaproteobacteria bacterium]
MSARLAESHSSLPNPLDLVEEIVSAHDWPFDRCSTDEIVVDIAGQWCDYHLHFAWLEDLSAMHFSCALDMKIPKGKRGGVHELLALVNEKLWLGHFDVSDDDGLPIFRQTSLLRGAHGPTVEQLEDLVDIAITECERFYPAFQFVVWGGKTPREAIDAALLDCVGEA